MLDTVNSVLSEHKVVQADIDLFSVLVNEWNDLLRSARSGTFSESARQALADKQFNLLHSINNLREEFFNHHVTEENILKPVLGDLLAQALSDEHKSIVNRLASVEQILVNANLHEPLPDSFALKNELDSLCRMISEHNSMENGILNITKKYLEKKPVKSRVK